MVGAVVVLFGDDLRLLLHLADASAGAAGSSSSFSSFSLASARSGTWAADVAPRAASSATPRLAATLTGDGTHVREPCTVEVAYGVNFSVRAVALDGEYVDGATRTGNDAAMAEAARTCVLWRVVDVRSVVPRLAPGSGGGGFAVLHAASSLSYALGKYDFAIMSANAYTRLHGYRHYLYTSPEADLSTYSSGDPKHWLRYLYPKKHGMEAVFDDLDREQPRPERAVLYIDFDGWFNLAQHANYSLEALELRLIAARRPDPEGFDVVVQGEPGLCSGVMIVYKTARGRQFWNDIERECWRDRQSVAREISGVSMTPAPGPICNVGPWEQLGFIRVIFQYTNNTAGLRVPGDVCMDSDWMCARNTFTGFGLAENSGVRWSRIAFVPKNGEAGTPQLHMGA